MLGGIAASFAIMIAFLAVLAHVRRDLLEPAALSAVGAYLTWRFAEAIEASRIESGRAPRDGGSSAPGGSAFAVGGRCP
jgi:hypothetical protein